MTFWYILAYLFAVIVSFDLVLILIGAIAHYFDVKEAKKNILSKPPHNGILMILLAFPLFHILFSTNAYAFDYIENTGNCVQGIVDDSYANPMLGFYNDDTETIEDGNLCAFEFYEDVQYLHFYVNGVFTEPYDGQATLSIGDTVSCFESNGYVVGSVNGNVINMTNIDIDTSGANIVGLGFTGLSSCTAPEVTPTPTPEQEQYEHDLCFNPLSYSEVTGFENAEGFLNGQDLYCPPDTSCSITLDRWEGVTGDFTFGEDADLYSYLYYKNAQPTSYNLYANPFTAGSYTGAGSTQGSLIDVYNENGLHTIDAPLVTDNLSYYSPAYSWLAVDGDMTNYFQDEFIAGTYSYGIGITEKSEGYWIKQPTVCVHYTDTNPVGATTNNPDTGLCIMPYPFTLSNLNIGAWMGYYWCEFQSWFITALNYLFVPTADQINGIAEQVNNSYQELESPIDSNLSSIITLPLSTIQEITTQTCEPLDLYFAPIDMHINLPCARALLNDKFPTIIALWDIISSGLIGYWVVVKILHGVKMATNLNEDEIDILNI